MADQKRKLADPDAEAPTGKMARAGPGELDLVYPFWYQVAAPTEITPPFLDPNGPLYSTDGLLNVRLTAPLVIIRQSNGNAIGVKTDGSITVNADGALQIGISTAGPLTTTANGIDLNIDPKTLVVDGSSGKNVLGVLLKGQGALQSSAQGIGVAVDESLQIVDNTLEVKVDAAGPLAVTAAGVGLQYDNTQFKVANGTLQLYQAPTSSVAAFTSGTIGLSSPTGNFVSSSNNPFNGSYFLQQINTMGMLTTSLYVKVDTTTMGTRPTGAVNENARYFTVWVSSFLTQCNPSNIGQGTLEPSNISMTSFEPARNPISPPVFNMNQNIPYYASRFGVLESYQPIFTGSLNTGSIDVRMQVTPVLATNNTTYNLIAFTFQCASAGLFNPTVNGTVAIGPVVHTCPAARAPVTV
ncbi:fiber-2 [Fowl aviadenovirus A]|nr:fiber-2 [Fowl aviadenovirus A]